MRIITNPTSRRGRGDKVTALVTSALKERGISYCLSITSKCLDATDLAKEAADAGEELVICIGGDGTVSEVAAGLANSKTVLAIIPAGTGNDFVRYLGIPKNPIKALDVALGGKLRVVDAATANGRVFINAAGSGFDVAVLHRTLHYKKMFHGLLAYVLGIFSALSGYPAMDAEITADGTTVKGKMLVINVANGQYFGGGMKVAPFADAADGLLDVTYVDELARYKIPALLFGFIKGDYVNWKITHHFRCTELTVTTSDSSLQLDGEILSGKTVHYKILPKAVSIKVPEAKSTR